MNAPLFRPTLKATRIMLVVAGLLVTAIGISLYLLTSRTDRYFAWTVASLFTAAFLGGSYWAAAVLEFLSAREKLWANSRPSVPAVTVFTALTLIVTLLHLDKFHFSAPAFITRLGTWVWLIVYISVPVILAVLFVLQERTPGEDPPRDHPLPTAARIAAAVPAAVMLLAGAGLLLAPTRMAVLWPWPLTALTGQAIGAWFVGLAVAVGQAVWENDLLRVRSVMISLVVFALLQFLVILRYSPEMSWGVPGAWLYVLLLAALFALGGWGVWAGRRATR